MLKVISSWRKPDKQAAYDDALERGSKLGMGAWVLPRDKLELGSKRGGSLRVDQSADAARGLGRLGDGRERRHTERSGAEPIWL